MIGTALIFAASAALSGMPCTGARQADPGTICAELIADDTNRGFTVYVAPQSIDRQVAARIALDLGRKSCAERYRSSPVPKMTARRSSPEGPGVWQISGTCK
ncbi:hypothetical protein VK792_01980 [Mesobacterium sp. TK19101]|uniref:Uncharacterized protein n=1 Tax=Mesobacterium hydrothermale TaxID=3111907 RepID=A0ABU6HC38_9RHOB|nr:hypothetical protein [Mesobacterium sp. TK19101]MEC3860042.1 hypothetical protein [Mesobacterium sp. TK19101]